MDYQVTFSDGSNNTRKFREIGQYPTRKGAKRAAREAIRAFFGSRQFSSRTVNDPDFVESEDWFAYAADNSAAVIVSINALPLTAVGNNKPFVEV